MRTMNDTESYNNIIEGLSNLITSNLTLCAAEQYHPSGDVDKMEDTILDCKTKVKEFRKLRESCENLYTGALL